MNNIEIKCPKRLRGTDIESFTVNGEEFLKGKKGIKRIAFILEPNGLPTVEVHYLPPGPKVTMVT